MSLIRGFTDLDAIERLLGKPVTSMTDEELVVYFRLHQKAINDIDLPVDGMRERSIFAGLKRTYGPAEAGRIVKWACWKHHGKDDKGLPLVYSSFTKGQTWRTERWYVELQGHMKKSSQEAAAEVEANQGWGSLRDL